MKPIVAIDIGSYLTKVIQLIPGGKGASEVSILKFLRTPLTKEGDIDKDAFFTQLESILPLSRLRSSELCVILPATAVNYAHFDFPKLPKSELTRAVLAEARKKILPAPAPQDNIKYIVQKETKVKEAMQLSIFAGSADKVMIDKYYSLFKQKGAIPIFVGSPETCLAGLFLECYAQQAHYAMINLGFKCTTLAIFSKGQIALTRNIPFAGNDIINAIAKQTKADVEQVSQLFVRNEIDANVLLPHWNYLLTEIRRSFAYYKSIDTSADVQSILLSGGVGALNSAAAYLKEHMRGNIEIFDLLKVKCVSSKRLAGENVSSLSPFFALGVGAAFAYKSSHVLMNFLPEEALQRRKERQTDSALLRIGVGITAVLFLIAVIMGILVQQNNTRAFPAAKREAIRVKLEEVKKGAELVQQKQKQLTQQITFIESIKKYELSWAMVITTLAKTMTSEKMYFRDFLISYEVAPKKQIGEYKFIIHGSIKSNFEEAREALEAFEQKLEYSGYFTALKSEPLKLEDVVYTASAKDRDLTEIMDRNFTIEGQVVKK